MFRRIGVGLAVVVVLGLLLAAVAAAAGGGGTSDADAVEVKCDAPVSGTLAIGERTWLWFSPLRGQTTGAAMWFNPVVGASDMTGEKTSYFKVWIYLKKTIGAQLTEIGRGTTAGPSWWLKTWRGGADQLGKHYLEVINSENSAIAYTMYLNCRWPIVGGSIP